MGKILILCLNNETYIEKCNVERVRTNGNRLSVKYEFDAEFYQIDLTEVRYWFYATNVHISPYAKDLVDQN